MWHCNGGRVFIEKLRCPGSCTKTNEVNYSTNFPPPKTSKTKYCVQNNTVHLNFFFYVLFFNYFRSITTLSGEVEQWWNDIDVTTFIIQSVYFVLFLFKVIQRETFDKFFVLVTLIIIGIAHFRKVTQTVRIIFFSFKK